MAGGLLSFLDPILASLALIVKQPLAAYCRLETAEDKYTLVSGDGSVMTILRIDGAASVVGATELDHIVEGARVAFAPYLERVGHAIQVWFTRDPDGSKREVSRALANAEKTAEALSLSLNDLFGERKKRMPEFITSERFYFALWTRPATLTKTQAALAQKDEKVFAKGMPPMIDGQRMRLISESVLTRHLAFVSSMISDLENLGIKAHKLTTHEAIQAVRGAIYPELLDSSWKPSLPGDPVAPRAVENGESADVSSLVWPSLASQIFTKNAEVLSPTQVRIGDLDYSPVDLLVGPEDVQPFSTLLSRLAESNIPWRVSFMLEGGGLQTMAVKGLYASILSWAAQDNKKIHQALQELKAGALEGETVIKLRVSFATWAPAGETRLLRERSAILLRGIEGWGHCQAGDLCGDPLEGAMSTALGLAVASTAPPGAAPISDAVTFLPWSRPANPWRQGSVLFRSPDGKIWPYTPGSHLQTSWIDLVFAPPGYGKSVLMNSINLAVCLAPSSTTIGSASLPRVAIIDIGPSSSGLVSLLKEALPRNRRHEVAYHRLRMQPDNAINPFDTQLGCRAPLPGERAFIVNLLTLLATPVGQKAPYDGITDLVGIVVDELYKLFGDTGMPRPYARGDDPVVDEAIDRHDIKLMDRPTWWEVVDALFEANLIHEANLAQRYAVPLLQDVVLAARSRAVEDLFGDTRVPTGENVILAFSRMISGAIREYPILASPTRFDIGGARVCALDLDEVAPRGGEAADRQTAVMYMLARHVLARDFYLNEETVRSVVEKYRGHHMKRAREMRETPKRLVYDEFHRTGAAAAVRAQVRIDIREGRKWGVQICLASQLLDDFDPQMVDQATGTWILGAGSEAAVKEASERFGLGDTARYILRNRLTGPTKAGAPLLAVLALKDGKYEQFLYNTLGPIELWAMSTTAEDAEIRRRLYTKIGPVAARTRLAEHFPSGTARPEIERRINAMMERGANQLDDQAQASLLDEIVEELANAGNGGKRKPAKVG